MQTQSNDTSTLQILKNFLLLFFVEGINGRY